MHYLGQDNWSVSAMIDRTECSAPGLKGAQEGAKGEFKIDSKKHPPKTVIWLEADQSVVLNRPCEGGFGHPFDRDPQAVLNDVIQRYITSDIAERDYGVKIKYVGKAESLVRLPEDYRIDSQVSELIRSQRN